MAEEEVVGWRRSAPALPRWWLRIGANLPGEVYALTSLRWKYVHEPGGLDRIFDLAADPFEIRALTAAEAPQAVKLRTELLDRIRQHQERGQALGEIDESTAEEIDAKTLDELRELGYTD